MTVLLNLPGSVSGSWLALLIPMVLFILIVKGSQKLYYRIRQRSAERENATFDNTFINSDRLN